MSRRLTSEHLSRIFSLGVDVATIDFEKLIENPESILNNLAHVCGVETSATEFSRDPINSSVEYRSLVMILAARMIAIGMRGLGLNSALQKVKDSQFVQGRLFKQLNISGEGVDHLQLRPAHQDLLRSEGRRCWETVRFYSESVSEGFFFADKDSSAP